MIESILLLIGILGSTAAIASSGSDDEDDNESNRLKKKSGDDNLNDLLLRTDLYLNQHTLKTDFNNLFIKPITPNTTHLIKSSYWENPDTGDYIRHRFDIKIK